MIIHTSITEQIVEYMKEKIESGEWKVGEKIPSENALTKELGVSRASVRDAIKYYVGQGLFQTYHGKGTYLVDASVNEPEVVENAITAADCANIRDVLEFRRAVESEACALAAERMDSEAIALLEYFYHDMENHKGDKDIYLKADMEFHRLIADLSGNVLLKKSLYQVMDESRDSFYQMFDVFGYRNGLSQHRTVLKALREKNPKAAKKAMYDHMQTSIEKLNAKEII